MIKCKCATWCRVGHTKDELFDLHHKDCPNKIFKKYAKLKLHGGGSYIMEFSELHDAIDGELADQDAGTKITIEIVSIPPDRFERMSEFDGH
jgi:hypothetical protein